MLLYELLTGPVPLTAATQVETLLVVRQEEPLPISRVQPGVPRDLQIITHKCLEKEPGRRYASARAGGPPAAVPGSFTDPGPAAFHPVSDQVVERLRTDTTLSEPLRRAAWHAVLRRAGSNK